MKCIMHSTIIGLHFFYLFEVVHYFACDQINLKTCNMKMNNWNYCTVVFDKLHSNKCYWPQKFMFFTKLKKPASVSSSVNQINELTNHKPIGGHLLFNYANHLVSVHFTGLHQYDIDLLLYCFMSSHDQSHRS